jgi:hypothetical protein
MPWLDRAKQRIGARIGSSATASEGKQNLLCAYLAAALLVGLLGNALFGASWLDPLVGLLIAGLAVERAASRGEGTLAAPEGLAPRAKRKSHANKIWSRLASRMDPGEDSSRRNLITASWNGGNPIERHTNRGDQAAQP